MGGYLGLHNAEFKRISSDSSFTMIDNHELCTKKNEGKKNTMDMYLLSTDGGFISLSTLQEDTFP